MRYRRGDIVWVKNHNTERHLQAKDRPAVVISNDVGNKYGDILIIAYMTANIKRMDMPTHVVIYSAPRVSMVMTEQLDTISENQVTKIVSRVTMNEMEAIDRGLMASLGLPC